MPGAQEKKFLHAFSLAGCEYDALEKIRAVFGSFERAWHVGESELKAAGIAEERARAMARARDATRPDDEMRKLIAQGIAFITADDPEFPEELHTIASPPLALYIKGRLDKKTPRIAVVGTRKATPYGREATRKLIRGLADETEVVIVSGLAQGIDAEAHRSALECGLPTIGVIGSGMDRASFFPPENWNLAEEIVAKGGAVISEYPPGAPALKHHFIGRNRIIAGLARATLVVEAPEKSGALITANFALEQGKDVFAVPGQMFSPNAAGAHNLIREGAALITSAEDIMHELGLEPTKRSRKAAAVLTGEREMAILNLLGEPASVDEIKEKTNLPTADIVSSLSMLELRGFIRSLGQNRFQKIS